MFGHLQQIVKYLLEGLTVALASHLIAGDKLNVKEIIILGLTAAVVFMVLEYYAPSVITIMSGGCPSSYNSELPGYDSSLSMSYAQVGGGTPYKLVDGMYSHKVLLAGFNENAKAANSADNCKNLSRYSSNEAE